MAVHRDQQRAEIPDAEAPEALGVEVVEVHVDRDARHITAPAEGVGALTRIAARLDEAGIDLDDIGLQRPSLDDVFLNLTGHRAEAEAMVRAINRLRVADRLILSYRWYEQLTEAEIAVALGCPAARRRRRADASSRRLPPASLIAA